MKANELRIGNLVNCNGLSIVRDINPDRLRVEYILNDNERNSSIPIELAEPIPLTEEWLLRFGMNDTQEKKPHFVNIFGNPHWIQYLTKIKGVVIHIGGGEHFTIPNTNHVHQLQNLYFALTGEELTITPGSKPD